MTLYFDAVMTEGCPHCGDGIPKIVTWQRFEFTENVQFVGDWDEDLKLACRKYGQLRIIACKPIEVEGDGDN